MHRYFLRTMKNHSAYLLTLAVMLACLASCTGANEGTLDRLEQEHRQLQQALRAVETAHSRLEVEQAKAVVAFEALLQLSSDGLSQQAQQARKALLRQHDSLATIQAALVEAHSTLVEQFALLAKREQTLIAEFRQGNTDRKTLLSAHQTILGEQQQLLADSKQMLGEHQLMIRQHRALMHQLQQQARE
jgi:hypothetical protein